MKTRNYLILLLFINNLAFSQWQDISPAGHNDVLIFDVEFINDNTGFAVGQNTNTSLGYIFKTTDGGLSWTYETHNNSHLRSVVFRDDNTGFIGGYDGPPGTEIIIFSTQDQGQNWTKTTDSYFKGINGMQFVNSNLAYSYGYGSAFFSNAGMMKTSNGGSGWSYIADNPGFLIEGMHFINVNTGFLALVTMAGDGSVQKTSNGGGSYSMLYSGTGDWIHDVFFMNEDTGFVVEGLDSSVGNILKTTDGGQSWTSSTVSYGLTKVLCLDNTTAYVFGNAGAIMKTTDCGYSWQAENSSMSSNIEGNSFSDNYVFACGRNGNIIKSLHGVISSNNDMLTSNNTIHLYPNPTSGITKLDLGATYDKIEIKVWDISGLTISSRIYNNVNQLYLNIEGANGIYFIEICPSIGKSTVLKLIKQ